MYVGVRYCLLVTGYQQVMAGKPPRSRVGMFSRATAVRDADGRTREAKIIKETALALTEHVGGQPTAPQKLLIDASAILVLRLRVALDRYATGVGDCESLDQRV